MIGLMARKREKGDRCLKIMLFMMVNGKRTILRVKAHIPGLKVSLTWVNGETIN